MTLRITILQIERSKHISDLNLKLIADSYIGDNEFCMHFAFRATGDIWTNLVPNLTVLLLLSLKILYFERGRGGISNEYSFSHFPV